tara:strand:+ start:1 stop:654 length:654 start_codon:yes stop_codon:yes gene_type:complete
MCDYCNFKLTGNILSERINILDIIDIKPKYDVDLENIPQQLKLINIGCIEKNKIIKYKSLVDKNKVKKSHFIRKNDILISCCRPNSDKTRLVTQTDIDDGYIANLHKVRIKTEYLDQYPPIYIYAILYSIIGEKATSGENKRNNFERMFAKSTSYPTIKLEMFAHLDIFVHKDPEKIKSWTKKLTEIYDKTDNNIEFKSICTEIFNELVSEFEIYAK